MIVRFENAGRGHDDGGVAPNRCRNAGVGVRSVRRKPFARAAGRGPRMLERVAPGMSVVMVAAGGAVCCMRAERLARTSCNWWCRTCGPRRRKTRIFSSCRSWRVLCGCGGGVSRIAGAGGISSGAVIMLAGWRCMGGRCVLCAGVVACRAVLLALGACARCWGWTCFSRFCRCMICWFSCAGARAVRQRLPCRWKDTSRRRRRKCAKFWEWPSNARAIHLTTRRGVKSRGVQWHADGLRAGAGVVRVRLRHAPALVCAADGARGQPGVGDFLQPGAAVPTVGVWLSSALAEGFHEYSGGSCCPSRFCC